MIPAGWKLVPIEPTEAMLNAVIPHMRSGKEYHKGRFIYNWHIEPAGWQAMLAAAPEFKESI
jgi:hypothetical protein